jgi:lipopolysaccharide/colanic/teichoic acid biosynthesis glycosyltransferase
MLARLSRVLPFIGIAAVVLVLAKLHARYIGEYDLSNSSRLGWTLLFIVTSCVVAYGFGVPDHEVPSRAAKASLASAVVAATVFSAIQLLAGESLIPRLLVVGSAPFFFAVLLLSGMIRRAMVTAATSRAGLLAIVDKPDEAEFIADLTGPLDHAIELRRVATVEHVETEGGLLVVARATQATLLVLGRAALDDPDLVAQAAELHENGMQVRGMLEFYDDWVGKIPVRELGRSVLMFDIAELHEPGYRRVSRLLDILIASVGLIPLIAFMPIVMLGNAVASRGPLIYRQQRVGRAGVEFNMLKFRSMRPGPATGEWAKPDDKRITCFGAMLRRLHVDELPQMINILRGDLSVVGPRPEQPRYVGELTAKIPLYPLRHLVRPGLTGWAQVNYPYGSDETDALEKLQYEFWYLRHQSLWLDLRIISRTFRHVIGFGGR